MPSFLNKYARLIHYKLSVLYGIISRLTFDYARLPPSKIHVIFTSKCNVACNFCYVEKNLNQKEPVRLTMFEWEKIVNSTPKTCVTIFSGGEPFASNDIYQVVDLYLTKKKLVSITTNGTIIDIEKIKPLIDKNLFYLMYSVHGLEKTHNKIVQRESAFEKIIRSLKQIDEYKKLSGLKHPLICIKTVISQDNVDDIPELITYFENSGLVNQMYFNLMSPITLHHSLDIIESTQDPRLYEDTSYVYPEDYKEKVVGVIEFIEDYKTNSKIDIGFTDDFISKTDMIEYIHNPQKFRVKSCNRPWHEFLLYYDGKITSCMGYKGSCISDVDYDVKKVLGSNKYRPFLDYIKKNEGHNKSCNSCKEAPLRS